MKLRVMGTFAECKQAQAFYKRLGRQNNVQYCTVSEPYLNRGCTGYYRVYIEIVYKDGSNLYAEPLTDERDTEDITNYPACGDDMAAVRV